MKRYNGAAIISNQLYSTLQLTLQSIQILADQFDRIVQTLRQRRRLATRYTEFTFIRWEKHFIRIAPGDASCHTLRDVYKRQPLRRIGKKLSIGIRTISFWILEIWILSRKNTRKIRIILNLCEPYKKDVSIL